MRRFVVIAFVFACGGAIGFLRGKEVTRPRETANAARPAINFDGATVTVIPPPNPTESDHYSLRLVGIRTPDNKFHGAGRNPDIATWTLVVRTNDGMPTSYFLQPLP